MKVSNKHNAERQRVISSARWAAYGDALGFITELTSPQEIERRIGSARALTTVEWSRKLGRFSPEMTLRPGTYSDDTQLRLATARAIRGDGSFDVDAFAKIELPVFLAYALRAGKSTRSAAKNLARVNTTWHSNFFGNGASYFNAGGNGAAMRVQPHVWASSDRTHPTAYLPSVLRNAIVTHGHPRGILGACFHAVCLAYSFTAGSVLRPNDWSDVVAVLEEVPRMLMDDEELGIVWLPSWEQSTGELRSTFRQYIHEFWAELSRILPVLEKESFAESDYLQILEELEGFAARSRGSGTKTAIAATALAWMFKNEPQRAIEIGANALGSDTDTICTMAGAILGVHTDSAVPGTVLDRHYIDYEAARLAALSGGRDVPSFSYPDPLSWQAPSTQLDLVRLRGNQLYLAGLGPMRLSEPDVSARQDNNVFVSCFEVSLNEIGYAQTVYCRVRNTPKEVRVFDLPATREPANAKSREKAIGPEDGVGAPPETIAKADRIVEVGRRQREAQLSLMDEPKSVSSPPDRRQLSIDEMLSQVVRSSFNASTIKQHLTQISKGDAPIDRAAAYISVVMREMTRRGGAE